MYKQSRKKIELYILKRTSQIVARFKITSLINHDATMMLSASYLTCDHLKLTL